MKLEIVIHNLEEEMNQLKWLTERLWDTYFGDFELVVYSGDEEKIIHTGYSPVLIKPYAEKKHYEVSSN